MRTSLLLLPALLATGCGLSTQVRPVPRGAIQVEGALGGPLVKLGPVIPVPLSTVGARYGVADRVDVAAHAHLTTLAFGVAGLDVGGSWLALEQDGVIPALSLGGRVYGFTQVLSSRQASPRAYVEVSPTVSYLLGGRFLSYVSATGLVQLAGGRPLLSLAVGEEVRLGAWGVQLDLRWYQPDSATRFNAADWQGLQGMGALGVVLGVNHRFGGDGR
ncbi:hypothetical protein [Archangium lipolyticum]|uniref:hypothetical protein n=1 Tax=Archangium lipolyticum TaxID=2970465 RepID=UPI00214A3927|nr:hypothetical protein [Archangium lipolyticum]